MEHEVFVPVPVERLREALDDPARVARAVPGLQHDAGADPVAGRLKLRVGSHSITYRGSVRVSRREDGSYAVEGDAVETRGTGAVKLALRLRPLATEGGATLTVDGTVTADGRVTELPADAVASAVVRLLNRFAENLGTAAGEPSAPESPTDEPPAPVSDMEVPLPSLDAEIQDEAGYDVGDVDDADDTDLTDVTDDVDEVASVDDIDDIDGADEIDEIDGADDTVVEAAHARRTMIGRSAEEVDHAPPRGRYAPVPAPQTVSTAAPLRWAAPAAALAVASAIVAVRALRRRR
ncbi:carbon monoxide dehydrogenase subunit G [Streptomyces sp. M2CJ-2]|uniref:SRPBCC domain-containing protein n=1 Tax=Streptomyces sp. M2CJ-2 TaxID=2803948 RepID=UPI001928B63F|nr:SRPBCC domain-containing protein [Streptomyces sp. M2CJ-2]MBL3669002.1 carbon monoxide dehydrogenase subunit G [Streptomyces sp. M2CJ-2]